LLEYNYPTESLSKGGIMPKDQWKELRDDLNAVARELAAAENGASAREIVAAFRKRRSGLVRAAADLLINTALTRLVGDVIKRRTDSHIEIDQLEMFERAITEIVAVSSSTSGAGRRDRYRTIGTLPVGLAEQMVKHYFETRRHKADRFNLYKEIIEFVRKHGASDNMTINDALAMARIASATGRAA
jgi:hypothetical protein